MHPEYAYTTEEAIAGKKQSFFLFFIFLVLLFRLHLCVICSVLSWVQKKYFGIGLSIRCFRPLFRVPAAAPQSGRKGLATSRWGRWHGGDGAHGGGILEKEELDRGGKRSGKRDGEASLPERLERGTRRWFCMWRRRPPAAHAAVRDARGVWFGREARERESRGRRRRGWLGLGLLTRTGLYGKRATTQI